MHQSANPEWDRILRDDAEQEDRQHNEAEVRRLLPAQVERWNDFLAQEGLRQEPGVGDTTPPSAPRPGSSPSSASRPGTDTPLNISAALCWVLDLMEHPDCWGELHTRLYYVKSELEFGRSPHE